jgi:hypothetical protein
MSVYVCRQCVCEFVKNRCLARGIGVHITAERSAVLYVNMTHAMYICMYVYYIHNIHMHIHIYIHTYHQYVDVAQRIAGLVSIQAENQETTEAVSAGISRLLEGTDHMSVTALVEHAADHVAEACERIRGAENTVLQALQAVTDVAKVCARVRVLYIHFLSLSLSLLVFVFRTHTVCGCACS